MGFGFGDSQVEKNMDMKWNLVYIGSYREDYECCGR